MVNKPDFFSGGAQRAEGSQSGYDLREPAGVWDIMTSQSFIPSSTESPQCSLGNKFGEQSAQLWLHRRALHRTEDFIRWKEGGKKEKEKATTLAGGRKALLPLDKGWNYFISVWSSKACERWIWHSAPLLIFSLQSPHFWVSSCRLQCDRGK